MLICFTNGVSAMIVDGTFPVKLTSSGVLFCNLVGNGPKRFRLSLEASDDVSVFLNHRYKYCTMIEAQHYIISYENTNLAE